MFVNVQVMLSLSSILIVAIPVALSHVLTGAPSVPEQVRSVRCQSELGLPVSVIVSVPAGTSAQVTESKLITPVSRLNVEGTGASGTPVPLALKLNTPLPPTVTFSIVTAPFGCTIISAPLIWLSCDPSDAPSRLFNLKWYGPPLILDDPKFTPH